MRCKEIKCDVCGQVICDDYFQIRIKRYRYARNNAWWEGWSREKKEICPACVRSLRRLVKAETKREEEANLGKSIL